MKMLETAKQAFPANTSVFIPASASMKRDETIGANEFKRNSIITMDAVERETGEMILK